MTISKVTMSIATCSDVSVHGRHSRASEQDKRSSVQALGD